MKFKKKPVVIDAVQIPQWFHTWSKSLSEEERAFGAMIIRIPIGERSEVESKLEEGQVAIYLGISKLRHANDEPSYCVTGAAVSTLEGVMRGNVGDYLITGVKGERYFCKPDIFEMTYEPAE